jgi:hypothetical protein
VNQEYCSTKLKPENKPWEQAKLMMGVLSQNPAVFLTKTEVITETWQRRTFRISLVLSMLIKSTERQRSHGQMMLTMRYGLVLPLDDHEWK